MSLRSLWAPMTLTLDIASKSSLKKIRISPFATLAFRPERTLSVETRTQTGLDSLYCTYSHRQSIELCCPYH